MIVYPCTSYSPIWYPHLLFLWSRNMNAKRRLCGDSRSPGHSCVSPALQNALTYWDLGINTRSHMVKQCKIAMLRSLQLLWGSVTYNFEGSQRFHMWTFRITQLAPQDTSHGYLRNQVSRSLKDLNSEQNQIFYFCICSSHQNISKPW